MSEFRARLAEANQKGKGDAPPSKGKGKQKGKGKFQGNPNAKAKPKAKADTAKVAHWSDVRASSAHAEDCFPKNGIALDSWANVHLVHEKKPPAGRDYPHQLNLAHGTCPCFKTTGRKGVEQCFVPHTEGGDNIDLFPEGYLWERGCTIARGAEHSITTPKG